MSVPTRGHEKELYKRTVTYIHTHMHAEVKHMTILSIGELICHSTQSIQCNCARSFLVFYYWTQLQDPLCRRWKVLYSSSWHGFHLLSCTTIQKYLHNLTISGKTRVKGSTNKQTPHQIQGQRLTYTAFQTANFLQLPRTVENLSYIWGYGCDQL